MTHVALVAGRGALPARLIAACEARGDRVTVCGLDGFADDLPRNDRPFRLETLGRLLADLRAEGAQEACLAGAVQRPELDASAVDAATAPLMERVTGALAAGGDDGALRVLLSLFEEAGLAVRGAADLVPGLLPPEGVLTARHPAEAHARDAARAGETLALMGRADVGQACVVRGGHVLAVEALPGTDWMLESLAALPPDLPERLRAGGLLYKAPKPGQDRRVDLPLIGPDTVAAAARARLDGIALEAGGVMVLDRAETVAAADAAGLFLWVRRAQPDPE
jgi:hypothetical protein